MPYRRKFRKRRRKQGKWKSRSAIALAKRNARILSHQMPEMKYHDVNGTGTVSAAGASTVIAVSAIPQGDGPAARDGSKVTLKSMNVRMYLQKSGSATQATFVRIQVIQSLVGDTPTSSTIFNATPYVTSFRNLNHTTDFKVLVDRMVVLNDNNDEGKFVTINLSRFACNTLSWDQTDTTGASARKGKLYIFLTTEEPTNPPSYTQQTRLRYIDN